MQDISYQYSCKYILSIYSYTNIQQFLMYFGMKCYILQCIFCVFFSPHVLLIWGSSLDSLHFPKSHFNPPRIPPDLLNPAALYREREGEKRDGQSDSNGKFSSTKKKRGKEEKKKKKTISMSSSCSAVRSVEATVRAEIGMSASSVMDVSLYDCWTSVQSDGCRQKLLLFDSKTDTKPWC